MKNIFYEGGETFRDTPSSAFTPPSRPLPEEAVYTTPHAPPYFAYLIQDHEGKTVSQGIVALGEEKEGAPKVWYEDGKLHYRRPFPLDMSQSVFIDPVEGTPEVADHSISYKEGLRTALADLIAVCDACLFERNYLRPDAREVLERSRSVLEEPPHLAT